MHTKEFGKFVWEEELKVLGMPFFYLGKHLLSKFIILYINILIPGFTILGLGCLISITTFICEKVVYHKKKIEKN